LIDITKFNLVLLGEFLHYDSWQGSFWSWLSVC
jgi:hypothetical protein